MDKRVETSTNWPERITDKRACGCEYISERDPTVRKGYELGGYLSKVCLAHSRFTPLPVHKEQAE